MVYSKFPITIRVVELSKSESLLEKLTSAILNRKIRASSLFNGVSNNRIGAQMMKMRHIRHKRHIFSKLNNYGGDEKCRKYSPLMRSTIDNKSTLFHSSAT